MKVIKAPTGRPATWGTMFLREIVGKFLVGGSLALVTLGILNFMLLWDSRKQQIWDKVATTLVVDDRDRQLG